MRLRHALIGLVVIVAAAVAGVGSWYRGYLAGVLPSAAAEMSDITLPPGFHIGVYAGSVPNARQMALGPPGVVFVGSLSEGKVYAVVDRDGDHRAEKVYVLASGLTMPSGLAFRDGALYVAAVNRILKFPDVARDLRQRELRHAANHILAQHRVHRDHPRVPLVAHEAPGREPRMACTEEPGENEGAVLRAHVVGERGSQRDSETVSVAIVLRWQNGGSGVARVSFKKCVQRCQGLRRDDVQGPRTPRGARYAMAGRASRA